MNNKIRRTRTTVSLVPSVWRLAEVVGGDKGRGNGIETITVILLGLLAKSGYQEAKQHLEAIKEELKNARTQ